MQTKPLCFPDEEKYGFENGQGYSDDLLLRRFKVSQTRLDAFKNYIRVQVARKTIMRSTKAGLTQTNEDALQTLYFPNIQRAFPDIYKNASDSLFWQTTVRQIIIEQKRFDRAHGGIVDLASMLKGMPATSLDVSKPTSSVQHTDISSINILISDHCCHKAPRSIPVKQLVAPTKRDNIITAEELEWSRFRVGTQQVAGKDHAIFYQLTFQDKVERCQIANEASFQSFCKKQMRLHGRTEFVLLKEPKDDRRSIGQAQSNSHVQQPKSMKRPALQLPNLELSGPASSTSDVDVLDLTSDHEPVNAVRRVKRMRRASSSSGDQPSTTIRRLVHGACVEDTATENSNVLRNEQLKLIAGVAKEIKRLKQDHQKELELLKHNHKLEIEKLKQDNDTMKVRYASEIIKLRSAAQLMHQASEHDDRRLRNHGEEIMRLRTEIAAMR